jgi:hypothetical protein
MSQLSVKEQNDLRVQFKREFDKTEVKSFFYHLGLEVDNLEIAERDKLIFDLVHFCHKQARLDELLAHAKALRPNVPFPILEALQSPTGSPAATVSNTVSNTLPHSSILSNKPQIFISYAWNEKDSEENERLVNQLQADLSQRNIEIIRDKQHLGYKGDIKQFMQQIGQRTLRDCGIE